MKNELSVHDLVLVGTVHRDRQGEARLQELLARLAPDELTLEMSPTSLHFRRQRSRFHLQRLERLLERLAKETGRELTALQRHRAVADIRNLLALPFEYRAAADYARRSGIPLTLVDQREVAAQKLARIESELITYRNLRILVGLPEKDAPCSDEGYETARALLFGHPPESVCRDYLARRRGREGVGPRDRHMALQIRRRLAGGKPRCLVHVGGWVHLLEDPAGETLFSLLADLGPRRQLLG